jgi:hypothetical protein
MEEVGSPETLQNWPRRHGVSLQKILSQTNRNYSTDPVITHMNDQGATGHECVCVCVGGVTTGEGMPFLHSYSHQRLECQGEDKLFLV